MKDDPFPLSVGICECDRVFSYNCGGIYFPLSTQSIRLVLLWFISVHTFFAHPLGFEPRTSMLTAFCSTSELWVNLFCGLDGTRTHNPLINSQVLYQLRYQSIFIVQKEGLEPTFSTTTTNIQDISLARYNCILLSNPDSNWKYCRIRAA